MEKAVVGRTFADLVILLSTEHAVFRRLAIRTAAAALCMFIGAYAILSLAARATGADAPRIEVDVLRGHLLLVSEARGRRSYVTAVPPGPWQNTGIPVKQGQQLSITTGGQIQVDFGGLVHQTALRRSFEQAMARQKRLDPHSSDPRDVPEEYYSDDQVRALRGDDVVRLWHGPAGEEPQRVSGSHARSEFAKARSAAWAMARAARPIPICAASERSVILAARVMRRLVHCPWASCR